MKRIDTVLFDWDGTLVDTARFSFNAFQKSFRDLGIYVDPDLYQRIFSPDWYSMYRALLLPMEKWREAERLWLHHYGKQLPEMTAGAGRILDELGRAGYTLGVVTSGNRSRVAREIEGLGLDGTFEVLVCDEDVRHKKPHPEGLQVAMSRLGRPPQTCCYVGDCREDIEMGKRAGVRTVAVRSGYPNSETIREDEPDIFIDLIVDILEHLK